MLYIDLYIRYHAMRPSVDGHVELVKGRSDHEVRDHGQEKASKLVPSRAILVPGSRVQCPHMQQNPTQTTASLVHFEVKRRKLVFDFGVD